MSANSTKLREHFVLLENNDALQAAAGAATRRGFSAEIANDISDEPIEVGCEKLLARLRNMRESNPARMCLISGGEFACPVKGNGIGGRNLENALRLAIAANSTQSRFSSFVALCAGTDGIDGNSPAAGAIVDHTTIDRALKIGLDPQDFLDRSDTYSFFVALGDAITTGPTGTNVRDLRILLTGE
jgi:hydroxypyruvate reductase